jgi:hypothetical protein
MAHAAVCGFSDIVLRLLDAGVDVNQRYRNNVTALMWAASYQDGVGIRAAESVIDLLLKSGAEVDAVNDRGCTALMMAAEVDHAEVVDMLIRSGADSLRFHCGTRGEFGTSAVQVRRGWSSGCGRWVRAVCGKQRCARARCVAKFRRACAVRLLDWERRASRLQDHCAETFLALR